jgi:hypothetical protein
VKALQLVEMSGTTHPGTRRQMPEDVHPERVIAISNSHKAGFSEIA